MFSDAAFHEDCLREHQYGLTAIRWVDDRRYKVSPRNRKCEVCNQAIENPDDHIFIDALSSDVSSLLKSFEFIFIHISCLSRWTRRNDFIKLTKDVLSSSNWKGKYLTQIIEEIESKIKLASKDTAS
jgi:hypothetical protein